MIMTPHMILNKPDCGDITLSDFLKLNTHPFPQPVGLLRKRQKDPRTKASIDTQLSRVVCGITIRIFESEWYARSTTELTEKRHSFIRSSSACAGILLHQEY